MAIFKISELDSVSSLNDTDKLLVSKDLGTKFGYRNIDFADFKSQVGGAFEDEYLKKDEASSTYATKTALNTVDSKFGNYTETTALTGFTTQEDAKNYSIQLSSDGTAYVHVGWTGGSASDVAVDDVTIKKKTDGTNKIYVNQITKSNISDFPTSLSSFSNEPGYVTESTVTSIGNRVSTIESYIPTDTALSNQLADKKFVNSSIATNTANFIGTFTDFDVLSSQSATNNDYAFLSVSVDGNSQFKRYKYSSTDSIWKYEYTLNNSSFTSGQWNAINSNITADKVLKYEALSGTVDARLTEYSKTTDIANTYSSQTALNTVDAKFVNYTNTTDLETNYLKKTDASSTYLSKTDAGNTYATQTSLSTVDGKFSNYTTTTNLEFNYLKKTDASTTYLSKTDASSTYETKTNVAAVDAKFDNYTTTANLEADYLKKTDASSTYISKTDAATTYLSKTDASSTYATQTSLNTVDAKFDDYTTTSDLESNFLKKTDASSTYLSKTDASSTYETKTDASAIDAKFANYTTTTNLESNYLKKTDASSTYETIANVNLLKSQIKDALKDTFSTLVGNVTDGYNINLNQVIMCLNNIYNIVK